MGKVKAWVARAIMALPPVRWANKIDGEHRDREIRAIFETDSVERVYGPVHRADFEDHY